MAANSVPTGQQPPGGSSPPRTPAEDPGWTPLARGEAGGEVLNGAETGERFSGIPTESPQPEPQIEEPVPAASTSAASSSKLASAGTTASQAEKTGAAAQGATPPIKQERNAGSTATTTSQAQQASALLAAIDETATSSDVKSERGEDTPTAAPPANIHGTPTEDGTGVTLPDGEVLRFQSPPLEGLEEAAAAARDARDANDQTLEQALCVELGPNHPHAAVLARIAQDLHAEWYIVAENDTRITLQHGRITITVTRAGFDRIREHVGRGRLAHANSRREMQDQPRPASRFDRSRRRRSVLETVRGTGAMGEPKENDDDGEAAEDVDTEDEREAEVKGEGVETAEASEGDEGGNDDTIGFKREVKRED